MDPDPDSIRIRKRIRILLFSSLIFKRQQKTIKNKSFSAYYFLKVHLHHFWMWIRIRKAQKHVDSVDPDPDSDADLEHCFKAIVYIHCHSAKSVESKIGVTQK